MALGTLSIDLVAKLAKFEADMGKAARATEKTAQRIEQSLSVVKAGFAGLAGAVSFNALATTFQRIVDGVDALNDLADATGASIENLSALEDIALRTGTSFDTAGQALIKFNDSLKAAKPDSDIAKAFDAIGLSVAELKRLDPAEALRRTAVALAGFADDGNKARLVQELFGRSVREIAPLLKNLADQGSLVAKVTTEQARQAELYNRQLFELQKNFQDLSREMLSGPVAAFNKLAKEIRDANDAGKGLMATLSDSYWRRVRDFYQDIGVVGPRRNEGDLSGAGLAALTGRPFVGRIGNAGRGVVHPEFVRPSVGDHTGGTTTKAGRAGATNKGAGDDITDAQRALASYVDSLQDALDKTQDLTATEAALNFLRYQGAQGQVPQVRELVLGLANQVDETRRLKAETQALLDLDAQLKEQERSRLQAREDRLQSLIADTDTARLEQSRQDMLLLADAYERDAINLQIYTEAVQAYFERNGAQMEKAKSLAEELGLTFTSAFEDAVAGGKGLSNVLKSLEQDIIKLVTRQYVTKPLLGAFEKAFESSSGGGGIGGFFSNILGSLFGGARADGGFVSGGTPYLVGERGPELFVPRGSGTIVPNDKMASSTGRTIQVNVYPPPGGSRLSGQQIGADVARQLRLAEARNG